MSENFCFFFFLIKILSRHISAGSCRIFACIEMRVIKQITSFVCREPKFAQKSDIFMEGRTNTNLPHTCVQIP